MNGKRKFGLTVLIVLLSAVMVFAGKLDAAGWVTLATLALSIHAAANVTDKKLNGSLGNG